MSCSANSRLKTRRESAPCCVTSPRRACRSAEEGPLWGSDRGDTRKAGGDTLLAGYTVASPQAGRLSRRCKGPNFKFGIRPEIRRKRERPPPSIASEVRSPNRKRSGPLFRSTAIPAPRSTGPRHCQGLAPSLTPISRVFRSMIDCCQTGHGEPSKVSRLFHESAEQDTG